MTETGIERSRAFITPGQKDRKMRTPVWVPFALQTKCQLHYFTPVFYGGSFHTGV